MYNIYTFYFIEDVVGYLPFKEINRRFKIPTNEKKEIQYPRIGLAEHHTEVGCGLWRALLLLHSLMLQHKASSRNAWILVGLPRGLRSRPRELFGSVRNGHLRMLPEQGLVRQWSGRVWSWSPHENVWQVALRKNTKSGSSMWQLCIGRRQLRTGTELPSACLTKAVMRVASTCSVHGRFKEKGMCSAVSFVLGLLKLDSR